MSEHDQHRLRSELAAGSEEAFRALYDQYGTSLFRTAARYTRSVADAEDLVQELFTSLVRSRARLIDVKDLRTYMFVSLRRGIANWNERRHLHTTVELTVEPATDDAVPAIEMREVLDGALARLPDEQRDVIVMKFDGGLTFAEIASVLGTSANTVASRYRYGIQRLRESMSISEFEE